jgi:hypothetical protein
VVDLNSRIKSFNYGYIESKNKPSVVLLDKDGANVRQRTSQMWCLVRYLPLIIGHLVRDEECKNRYSVLLLLLSIMDIVFL